MAKKSIKLKREGGEKEFAFSHALAILRVKNSQWELAETGYIFENNEIVRQRPSKKADSKSSK
jgi:hypothetical protein